MPKRGDFDAEYDLEADKLLEDLEYFDDDTPEDIDFKNEVL
jgi:transcriptional adapter 2-alpha